MPNPHSLLERLQAHLGPQARDALEACAALCRQQGLRLFLVGGPVRDLLLDAASIDLDLAIEGDAGALATELAQAIGGRAVLHPRFGTARVSSHELHLDLAGTRRETYPHPGALPAVQPARLAEDLARRDFTINAMALQLAPDAGDLVDPFRGESDLRAGLLRVLHERSFQDDATRMLRAVRYASRLGFKLQRHSEALLRRDVDYLRTISGPRLRRELATLFQEPACVDGVLLAQTYGILQAIHPSLRLGQRVAERWRSALSGPRQAPLDELGFCLLTDPRDGGAVASVSQWLHLAGRIERALNDLVRLRSASDTLAIERPYAATRALEAFVPSAVWAMSLLETGTAGRVCEAYLTSWRHVRTHLRGNDLLALGVAQGEAIGELLEQLRAGHLERGGLAAEQEIEMVQAALRGSGREGGESEQRNESQASLKRERRERPRRQF
jgi:tRNA nucleotidyltransferase (CCA-adding enzyme)